jgi:DNA primase
VWRYLKKRGVIDAIAPFQLGYAPNSKSALREHLAKAGYSTREMIAAGMLVAGDDIPVAYDRFRHRIMFPIGDFKGRVIAFGGRALDPAAPAKYLNSPETPLFHKGAVLYNAHRARAAAHDTGQLLVVEGYMDVIALTQAGFPQAVAPLGTALTEDQLKLLWRMTPEPILTFDGDAAGRRAAFRAVETALPHLQPGHSVRFAFLPDGSDPDDLVRQHGPAAMQDLHDRRVRPLFDVLIEREDHHGEAAATPEGRAALEMRLKALVARIADHAVRTQYEAELRQTLWARNRKLVGEIAGIKGPRPAHLAAHRRDNTQADWRVRERASERRRLGAPPRATPAAAAANRSNELAGRSQPLPPREALLLRALLNHPFLLKDYCEQVAALPLTSAPLLRLRDALLDLLATDIDLETAEIHHQLSKVGLANVVASLARALTHKSDKFAEPGTDAAEVEVGWRHAVGLHERQLGLRRALDAAEQAWRVDPGEEAWTRIAEIQNRLAQSLEMEESSEF